MNIIKRDGTTQEFNKDKIAEAIRKVFYAVGSQVGGIDRKIAKRIYDFYNSNNQDATVEDVQDMVEDDLLGMGFIKEAKAYIKYRQERTKVRQEGWKMDDLQFAIWNNKYRHNEESFDEWLARVSGGNSEVAKLIRDRKFLFGGRILANRGLQHKGKKVTFSNCYVLPKPEDNLESIFNTARDMAKTYSMGGGVGISIGNLRPRGMAVNNTARTTSGSVSFMELYDLTTGLIGQAGRRGALMLSIPISHPDVEEFIDIKTEQGSVTKANISVQVTDEFMRAVINDTNYELRWEDSEGRKMTKTIRARELFDKNVKNNWDWAEAGFLFWDNINEYHIMSEYEDYEFAGTNPCGEVPLVAGGTCLLGSINLSEFVTDPFTDKAKVNIDGIEKAVRIAVRGLNEVLDEGEDLHPLQSQRDAVRDYRQIGLGVMGFADMLIKLGIKYGSPDCLTLIYTIGFIFSDRAISESSRIAVDNGSFKKFDADRVLSSKYIKYATSDETKEEIRKNGLRNSQIMAIAPTGTLSTLLGVSGGAEPIFATKFKRKTESVHNEDVYYDVYTPIVKEIIDRSGAIPDYVVTSHDVSWKERIDVQAYWQTFIDSAISSTVNLPNSITPNEVGELFKTAWDSGLKGVTIFRDGCKRAGILTVDDPDNEKDEVEEVEQLSDKYQVCSECGEKIEVIQNGCTICMNCGHSPC